MYDALIIGGGASGLAAAVTAVKRGKNVVVLEAATRAGRKLAAAGNGKCNISNERVEPDCYNSRFVGKFLEKSYKVREFWDCLGLKTRSVEGRIYPYSESGNTVINLLRGALPDGVIRTDCPAERVDGTGNYFTVNGIAAQKVVLATGSEATVGKSSYALYKNFGHRVTALLPVLTPLKSDISDIKGLAGVRAKVKATVCSDSKERFCESGEILFKENGLSGIVTMELSRFLNFGSVNDVYIDFAPDIDENELALFLERHSLNGVLHSALTAAVIRQSERLKLPVFKIVKSFLVKNVQSSGVKQAQVMRGGLVTEDFDEHLESKLRSGLYACGEVLDVDGACGGYNLHWAFLSGIIVGESL